MMSRATIIDERQDEEETQTSEITEEVSEAPVEDRPEEPSIPEKYRGKSVEDLDASKIIYRN